MLDVGNIRYLRVGESWPPIFVFVEDAQTHCARGVDVWVEQHRLELALWRFARVVLCELHEEGIFPAFPRGLYDQSAATYALLARDLALPTEDVSRLVVSDNRLR